MYQVICLLNSQEHILMDMRDEDYTIGSPKLTLQLNAAGSFEFVIYPNHPEFKSIVPLISLIKVYKINGQSKRWIFTGRVMNDQRDIYNTGKVKCEGILAYLIDSIVYPYDYQGTPADYVRQLIASHNSQVNSEKQFIIRTLDLSDADSNNNIVRENKNYPTTFKEFRDKVIKLLNAYISVEEKDKKIYFDCCQSINHYNSQTIRLGENIIDLKQTKNPDKIRTVIIGIGQKDNEGNRPTVLVENNDAINKYGRIVGTVEFDSVATYEQLKKKTTAYLDSILSEINTIEVKAIDLNMTDKDIEEISLGYAYVESAYNGLDHLQMLITKMDIYLLEPDKNTFMLGADKKSLTSSVSHENADLESKIHQVAKYASTEIEYKIDNATQLITGAKGGYVILDCGDDAKSHPTQILIMDTPDKATAKSVIRINKNGIGFSTTGYDGPYRNAWTIDGNLVADFITTGTMLADRIRGGTLEVGGTGLGKDGVISVLNASGNKVVKIDKDGIEVLKGSIKGTTITAGGSYNTDGAIIVKDSSNKDIVVINNNGIEVLKGSIKGTTITAGGSYNADGAIYIKDSSGNTKITIDVNGINVNNAFKVGMDGKITAVAISGGAVDQFSEMIDNSKAMKTAKEAIKKAKEAADKAQDAADKADAAAATAQRTADTANAAAATAQSAANTAQSAAETADKTANIAKTTVDNLVNTIIPQINASIQSVSDRVSKLENK